MDEKDKTYFEQPLTDSARICLRLEHLFHQYQESIQVESTLGQRVALKSILSLLDVIDRPDLKSKLAKTLSQQISQLNDMHNAPQVDQTELDKTLNYFNQLAQQLDQIHGRIADNLRNNEFLNNVRLQMGNPGGATGQTSPALARWLALSNDQQTKMLNHWLTEFSLLEKISAALLKLIRANSKPTTIDIQDGFYSQALDSQISYQLIRVAIPSAENLYPEISVGKHRLAIRFVSVDFLTGSRPVQTSEPLNITLSCCK